MRAFPQKMPSDKISGAKAEREALQQALAFARQGDTLTVWKLDRLAWLFTEVGGLLLERGAPPGYGRVGSSTHHHHQEACSWSILAHPRS